MGVEAFSIATGGADAGEDYARENIGTFYRTAAQAALCFTPGKRSDEAFMEALGALETALVDLAHRENVTLVDEKGNADPAKEEAFLRACLSTGSPGEKLSPMTRDAMMDLAVAQQEPQDKGKTVSRRAAHSRKWLEWIAAWQEAGAAVDAVERELIPPDKDSIPSARSAFNSPGEEKPDNPVERLKRLDILLADQGIEAGDLIIHPGILVTQSRREAPYVLIDIPVRNLQIAICEDRGQITFIGRNIRSSSFWAGIGKAALKNDPFIYPVPDRGEIWAEKIAAHFDGTFLHKVQSAWDGPFIEDGRAAGTAVLTDAYLRQLITWYQEKQGQDPSMRSETVWGKGENGKWVKLDEAWDAVNMALFKKQRRVESGEKSLAKFLDMNNLRKYSKPRGNGLAQTRCRTTEGGGSPVPSEP